MDIGTSIKTLRKKKGISQKDLAQKVGIAGASLSQIENNAVFPQKSTINRICEELQIPSSYLLFFSIGEEDVPEEKRGIFNTLNKMIGDLLLDEIESV